MKKRSIAILLGCLLALALLGYANSNYSEIITLSDAESQVQVQVQVLPNVESQVQGSEGKSSKNVDTYTTENVEEYLKYLESFDESNNEILGITTSMPTTTYGSGSFYMVTYQRLDEPREVRHTGKVSLFKTSNEEKYHTFLENFDESSNEILGITTSTPTTISGNGSFYMVTYRELK